MDESEASSSSVSTNENESTVELYIYDISKGMAKALSPALIGQQINGVWHTSIIVYGREYFFGSDGIYQCAPGGTILGEPNEVHQLGSTQIPQDVLSQQIEDLGATSFIGTSYDLFTHNCNNFSNELAQFLTGNRIPEYILNLPQEVLNTPLGHIIRRFAQQSLLPRQRGGAEGLEVIIRDRLLGLMSDSDGTPPPQAVKKRDVVAEVEEEERKEREEKKKNREPPIVFRDLGDTVDGLLDELEKSLDKVELNDEEMRCLKELREYVLGDEGSWVLSDEFLNLIGRVLLSGEDGIRDESRIFCLKILSWLAVVKDDVILVLHQDRRDHVIMRYASNIDQMSPKCQECVSLLLCNLFENLSTSEWLLYISEWDNAPRGTTSNIRVTTKVGVHALLSKEKEMKEVGSAIVYNLCMKEVKSAVFDDVAVEMALALLQFLSEKPPETLAWRGLKSLLRCCQLARAEVPSLVKMVGPSPSELKGMSKRCDEVVEAVNAILATV